MHAKPRAQFKIARETSTTGDANRVNTTAVWGVLDRESRTVRATVVPKVNREALQAAVLNQVEHGSKIYTDEASVYWNDADRLDAADRGETNHVQGTDWQD
jgi:hypothetical protein